MLPHAGMRSLTFAAMAAWSVGACSSAQMDPLAEDGPAAVDAQATDGSATDGPAIDAAIDAAPSGDAPGIDAAIDAPGTTCGISAGHTVALDGAGDLSKYPADQRMRPGVQIDADDEVAVAWDPTYLYLTVRSEAFTDGSRPLHVYLEAAGTLGTAAPSQGKEYSGTVPQLPFTPSHLIAIRRTTDFGTGPYNGVYLPGGAQPWTTRSLGLDTGDAVFASSDLRTLSVRTPWSALGGCPLALRLDLHVVNISVGEEWKGVVPSTHTPWIAPGGGHYEIALTGSEAISSWTLP